MARTKKELLPIDAAIARYLREGVEAAGISYREVASRTGISLNRIGIILRQEPPPATIGEMGQIAQVLGETASALLARAEAEVAESGTESIAPVLHGRFRANVGGTGEDIPEIPENVEEVWGHAAHPDTEEPIDHS